MIDYDTLTNKQLIVLLEDAEEKIEKLQRVEVAARALYRVIKGTCAAQTKWGVALKEALGEK